MKKVLLLSFISLGILASSSLSAQKKGKASDKNKANFTAQDIKTEADSISYAYGTVVTQGLPQFLAQMGILGDTTAITMDYTARIEMETGDKKVQLEKELASKLDSVNAANAKNMEQFILGFKDAAFSDSQKEAFNSGIAVGSQILSMSKNFAKEMLDDVNTFNKDAFVSSFTTVLQNGTPIMSSEEAQQILESKQQAKMQMSQAKQDAELRNQFAAEIEAGEKFMAENKSKDGVVVLPDGLQYKVITQGEGAKPTASDVVKVHYKGTLIDGTQFDSSYDRGEPTTFGVSQVIPGWTEALQLMPVGSKWILYIPYDLAYGTRNQGTIKPFSDLIFEVELLDIVE